MTPATESPQARLSASRKALVRQMVQGDDQDSHDANDSTYSAMDDENRSTHRSSTWQVFTQAVMAWWRHHPVQVAVDIGRPFLSNYARDKPLQLLGIAAGVGAVVVLVKPWRLVSITGLAVAALKSTRLSSSLLSMLSRPTQQQHAKQTQQP